MGTMGEEDNKQLGPTETSLVLEGKEMFADDTVSCYTEVRITQDGNPGQRSVHS